MSIGKLRSLLYGTAKILGDVNAVKRGTVKKRIMRRIAGRVTGKVLVSYSNNKKRGVI